MTGEVFLLKVLKCDFACMTCKVYKKKEKKIYWANKEINNLYTEAVARRCSMRKMFLEISQNSQENTYARVSLLIKLQASPEKHLKTGKIGFLKLQIPWSEVK